ncbi:MAG: tetratricopeptide repeat protein, partial [Bacteroidota bacterium]|nr:tetratricopeptide repeat protein [Bacteroidota bacterium]
MFHRLFLLAFLALLMVGPCVAQKASESYKKTLTTRTSAKQLLNEAEPLTASNPDSALYKVQHALAISVAQGDSFSEGRAYILLAKVNEGILEWKLAYENYLRAKEKLASRTHAPEYVETLRGLGNMALKLQDYTPALQYYNEALALRLSNAERMEFT